MSGEQRGVEQAKAGALKENYTNKLSIQPWGPQIMIITLLILQYDSACCQILQNGSSHNLWDITTPAASSSMKFNHTTIVEPLYCYPRHDQMDAQIDYRLRTIQLLTSYYEEVPEFKVDG